MELQGDKMTLHLVTLSELEQLSQSGDVLLGCRLCRRAQELFEAAMDVIGCREIFELAVQRHETGAIEQ